MSTAINNPSCGWCGGTGVYSGQLLERWYVGPCLICTAGNAYDRLRSDAVNAQEALMDSGYRNELLDFVADLHPHVADRILGLYWDALAASTLLVEALDVALGKAHDRDPAPFP